MNLHNVCIYIHGSLHMYKGIYIDMNVRVWEHVRAHTHMYTCTNTRTGTYACTHLPT